MWTEWVEECWVVRSFMAGLDTESEVLILIAIESYSTVLNMWVAYCDLYSSPLILLYLFIFNFY